MTLNVRQQRFVDEYLISGNATEAYKRAGYTANSVNAGNANSARLIRNDKIKAAIEEGRRAMAERFKVTAEQIIEEYRRIAFIDPRAVFTWGPDGVTITDSKLLPPEVAACIAEVSQTVTEAGGTIRVKLHDKLNALDRLGKHLGMFIDRTELSGSVEIKQPAVIRVHEPSNNGHATGLPLDRS